MAAVYSFSPDTDHYQGLFPVSDAAIDRLLSLGRDPAQGWKAPNLRWIGATKIGDFPYVIGHFPVVSERALDVMLPFFQDTSVLDVKVEGGGYYGLHIRDFPNCLDTNTSEIEWFEPGRARDILTYNFKSNDLQGHDLFRLPELAFGHAYLSDRLWDAIQNADLKGLLETKVWEQD